MQPLIASYSDFSAQSVHKIEPRYEPMKTYKKKRKYPSEKQVISSPSHISYFKAPDKFSARPLFMLDANPPKEQVKPPKKEIRPRSARKAKVDNVCTQPKLDWDFKPLTKHRENWLFTLARPETDFTPKVEPKKIPISLAAIVLKNMELGYIGENDGKYTGNQNRSYEEPAERENDQGRDSEIPAYAKENVKNEENIVDEYKEYPCDDKEILAKVKQSEADKKTLSKAESPAVGRPKDEQKAINKYFSEIEARNHNYSSEYKSQYVNLNSAKALAEFHSKYNLK